MFSRFFCFSAQIYSFVKAVFFLLSLPDFYIRYMKTLILPAFCLLILHLSAQHNTSVGNACYTDELWQQMAHRDSSLLLKRQAADKAWGVVSDLKKQRTKNLQQPQKQLQRNGWPDPTFVIPTVIYIVHDGTAASNISMNQIQGQMDQLNDAFAPFGYSFCYAKRNVADTSWFVPQPGDSMGVFRIYDTALSNVDVYAEDVALKQLSNLPAANYFRIFVVNKILPAGILGYAQFPGGDPVTDGVVVKANVFGSANYCLNCNLFSNYNLGAVMVHEAGHYLNLHHTFQGGCIGATQSTCSTTGDLICDTPPTDANYGCPATPVISCNGTDTVLLNNYMEYTYDNCKNAFTQGQRERMDWSVLAYRPALVSQGNLLRTKVDCAGSVGIYADFTCANFNGCINQAMTFASLTVPGTTYTWDFGDGNTATGDTAVHSYTTEGSYTVSLTAFDAQNNLTATQSKNVFITACEPIACGYNKWNFEFGFLDFSSGTPIATDHPPLNNDPWSPAFFLPFYRADAQGNPLFHIGYMGGIGVNGAPLLDANYNIVDTLEYAQASYNFRSLVPVPEKPEQFCFINIIQPTSSSVEMVYSIIEMNNGVPGVVPGKKWIRLPFPDTTVHHMSQATGIPSCDGKTLWLVVPASGYPFTYVFRMDSSAVITFYKKYNKLGPLYDITPAIASPNGNYLAYRDIIYPFNKNTGDIDTANLRRLAAGFGFENRLCFSPNSRFLYINENMKIYQYDLLHQDLITSRKLIANEGGSLFMPGPDKKIYIGTYTEPENAPETYRLGVINFPDEMENGLNSTGYNPYGPSIIPETTLPEIYHYGLWGFKDNVDAYNCQWTPNVPHMFKYAGSNCTGYKFYAADECFATQWNFGDPASGAANTSTLTNPMHQFSAPGSYTVRLQTGGYTFTDIIKVEKPAVAISSSNVTPCPSPHGNYSLTQIQPWVNYQWIVNGGAPAYINGANNIDVYWHNGQTSGSIKLLAVDTVSGCSDSAVFNITIPAANAGLYYTSASVCAGEQFNFFGQLLDTAGSYMHVATTATGCDSTIILSLSVLPAITANYSATICASDSFSFNGQVLKTAGSYTAHLAAVNGCDSTVTLQLSVLPVSSGSSSAAICNRDSIVFNGVILKAPGTYVQRITAANGCDSVVTMQLSLLPAYKDTLPVNLCAGDSLVYQGQILNTPGAYAFHFNSSQNCDSTVVLMVSGDNPVVSWVGANDTVNSNGIITLSGGTPAGGNYSGSGVVNNTFNPTLAGTGTVVITYTYTDSNGCTGTASHNFVLLAIQETFGANDIYVYPNPATNELIITGESLKKLTALPMLYNVAGQLIKADTQRRADDLKMDITFLPPGIYYLALRVNTTLINKKFVKM